jgi:integrase
MSEVTADHSAIYGDIFLEEIARIPPLPRAIIYEDDFTETKHTIHTDLAHSEIRLSVGGESVILNLHSVEVRVRELIRIFVLELLLEYSPGSVQNYFYGLRKISAEEIEEIAMSSPMILRGKWTLFLQSKSTESLLAIKRFIAYLCARSFGSWEPHHHELSSHLSMPRRDMYSTVRSGDCFLEIEEEAQLVRWLDNSVFGINFLSQSVLVNVCLVLCSYQFGMRPVQLGMLRKRDVSVRFSEEDGSSIVHLTFRLVKQRDSLASRLPMLRKVKREWAPLLAALYETLATEPLDAFLFGIKSRQKLSIALTEALNIALPGYGRVGYDLRHSLAQRMVDAGASQEELASALGHTHLKTGLVYFRASANQAELVNKALGLSETYLAVAKIASDRFISTEALSRLKGEQQVAGVPHGIPIAGIGGCATGQSSCPYNPITACYGCPKFMPVKDIALHEQVLKDFRSVVNLYKTSGAGDQESPAYLQLRRTIADVQGVISQMEFDLAT